MVMYCIRTCQGQGSKKQGKAPQGVRPGVLMTNLLVEFLILDAHKRIDNARLHHEKGPWLCWLVPSLLHAFHWILQACFHEQTLVVGVCISTSHHAWPCLSIHCCDAAVHCASWLACWLARIWRPGQEVQYFRGSNLPAKDVNGREGAGRSAAHNRSPPVIDGVSEAVMVTCLEACICPEYAQGHGTVLKLPGNRHLISGG